MNQTNLRLSISFFLIGIAVLSGFQPKPKNDNLQRAKITLEKILTLYDAGHDHLFNETYPVKPGNKVTYLVDADTVTTKRVAYLWPTSGVYSGVNALLRSTHDKHYRKVIDKQIIPGLEQYLDTLRKPSCYQSYIALTGKSDRYYDDNIWVALDLCETFSLTGDRNYLNKSIAAWKFVISGWDNELGGGIYWCEQKKRSKNTCSNAPAAVLAFKLFEVTGDSSYYKWGLHIYNWTKANLQDTTDFLYFDNKSLNGRTDRKKYTYNSGQMLQSAAILYRLTGKMVYLDEAHKIAKSAIEYFTKDYTTNEGKRIRLFINTGTWFNSILMRGYVEMYRIDKDKQYLTVFRNNMDQLWNHVRNHDGLFSKDWTGSKEDELKGLLDQSGLVEMWAELSDATR